MCFSLINIVPWRMVRGGYYCYYYFVCFVIAFWSLFCVFACAHPITMTMPQIVIIIVYTVHYGRMDIHI